MTSRRLLKAAEAIREVVSLAILVEIQDPRVRDVTVTHVEVAPDMRTAKVHVSVMGDDVRQRLSLRGLESAAGFLQAKVAKRIDTRYTPRLQFVLDPGVKNSIEIARILREVLPPAPEPADAAADEPAPRPASAEALPDAADAAPPPSAVAARDSDSAADLGPAADPGPAS